MPALASLHLTCVLFSLISRHVNLVLPFSFKSAIRVDADTLFRGIRMPAKTMRGRWVAISASLKSIARLARTGAAGIAELAEKVKIKL